MGIGKSDLEYLWDILEAEGIPIHPCAKEIKDEKD